MASLTRKRYTKPLPDNAEIVERNGRDMVAWQDRHGKQRYDELFYDTKGRPKIIRYTSTYYVRYRDAEGVDRFQGTGCRDEQTAQYVMAEIMKRVEQVKAGVISPEQDRMLHHAKCPLSEHLEEYLRYHKKKAVRGRRISPRHHCHVGRQLRRISKQCKLRTLADIKCNVIENWMDEQETDGMSASTRNKYRASIVAFCNWCVRTGRMKSNPLSGLRKADERADRRRIRRAMTEEEVGRLLLAARLRPVANFGRETHRNPRDGHPGRTWGYVPLAYDTLQDVYARGEAKLSSRPRALARLKLTGMGRSVMYLVMLTTGLRKSEVASLTVGQLELDAEHPFVELLPKHEKAGRGAKLPLREDVVQALREYLEEIRNYCDPEQRLPASRKLFRVPGDMVRIFDLDMKAADIEKVDERGRTLDLHSLRHTFGTHLARAGVAPRVAMAAMRHSTLELTMNVYTDPTLLDVGAAINALPGFQADKRQDPARPDEVCR